MEYANENMKYKIVSNLNDFIILDDFPIDYIHNSNIQIKIIKRKIDNNFYRMIVYPLNEYYGIEIKNQKLNFLIPKIRLILSATSKNILQYFDSFIEKTTNSLLFITEFAYDTLESTYIKKYKNMSKLIPQDKLIDIIYQISNGLNILHSRKIYNINLSCDNIFIINGLVKINPFCPIFNKDNNSSDIVCPEIAYNKNYEINSDIWYFGLLIYELCCLKPMKRMSIEDLNMMYSNILKEKYDPIPNEYCKEIKFLIKQCLHYSPDKRISSDKIMKLMIKLKNDKLINNRINLFKKKEKSKGIYIENVNDFNKALLKAQNYRSNYNNKNITYSYKKNNLNISVNNNKNLNKSVNKIKNNNLNHTDINNREFNNKNNSLDKKKYLYETEINKNNKINEYKKINKIIAAESDQNNNHTFKKLRKNKSLNIFKNINLNDSNIINNNKKYYSPSKLIKENKSYNNIFHIKQETCFRCYRKRLAEKLVVDKAQSFDLIFNNNNNKNINSKNNINKIDKEILDLNSMMKLCNIQSNNFLNQYKHNENIIENICSLSINKNGQK